MLDDMIRGAIKKVLGEKLPGVKVHDWVPLEHDGDGEKCQKCGRDGAWVVRKMDGAVLLALCGICLKGVTLGRPLPDPQFPTFAGEIVVQVDMSSLESVTMRHGFESDIESHEWWMCTLCGQPIHDPAHRDDKFLADMVERVTHHIDRATGLKYEYLEAMTAAYLLKTKVPPEGVELVQQMRGNSIHFWFQKRGDVVPGAPPRYSVHFKRDDGTGGYVAVCPDFPSVVAEGDTLDEARLNIADAIGAYVRGIRDGGEPRPSDVIIEEIEVNVEDEEEGGGGAGGQDHGGH